MSGRVGSRVSQVGSGRVGSRRFQISRVGSGWAKNFSNHMGQAGSVNKGF